MSYDRASGGISAGAKEKSPYTPCFVTGLIRFLLTPCNTLSLFVEMTIVDINFPSHQGLSHRALMFNEMFLQLHAPQKVLNTHTFLAFQLDIF